MTGRSAAARRQCRRPHRPLPDRGRDPVGPCRPPPDRRAPNWPAIVALYDHLLALTHSPVVALNRAAALAEIEGPDAALASLDAIADDKRMADYQPYWAARGHLAARAGHKDEAHEALTLAIGLATTTPCGTICIGQRTRLQDG